MVRKFHRFQLLYLILALFVASCATTQATTPAASPVVSSPGIEPTEALATPTEVVSIPSTSATITPTIDTASGAVRFVVVPEKSEARYRVREQLASVSLPSDAIGKTQDISGAIAINPDGTILSSESKFVVNMSTLQSDRSQRDNFVRRNTLKTDQYPEAVFVPTQVTGLPAELPQSGDVAFKLIGDLTILDVTKQVEWDVTGNIQSGVLTAQASTSFTFADFKLNQPRVPVVLSVEDTIKLELDFTLNQVNG